MLLGKQQKEFRQSRRPARAERVEASESKQVVKQTLARVAKVQGRAGSPLPAAGWNDRVWVCDDGAHGVTRPTINYPEGTVSFNPALERTVAVPALGMREKEITTPTRLLRWNWGLDATHSGLMKCLGRLPQRSSSPVRLGPTRD